MVCDRCGKSIAQVSGKGGGYYGCGSAAKAACDNRLLVRRRVVEKVVLSALRDRVVTADNVDYILGRVEGEVERLTANLPEALRLKQAELAAEERKIGNFVGFIGEGRGSRALADALAVAEARADQLRGDISILEQTRTNTIQRPPRVWIEERLARVQHLLEQDTGRSALVLRKVLGPIRLEPTKGDIGRPYYQARSTLDVLALLESGAESDDSTPGSISLWKGGPKGNRTPVTDVRGRCPSR